MQRDQKKLIEAKLRRFTGKCLLSLAIFSLVPYGFFIASLGYRDFLSLGHYSLLICLVLFSLAILITTPIVRLESPFLASLNYRKR